MQLRTYSKEKELQTQLYSELLPLCNNRVKKEFTFTPLNRDRIDIISERSQIIYLVETKLNPDYTKQMCQLFKYFWDFKQLYPNIKDVRLVAFSDRYVYWFNPEETNYSEIFSEIEKVKHISACKIYTEIRYVVNKFIAKYSGNVNEDDILNNTIQQGVIKGELVSTYFDLNKVWN